MCCTCLIISFLSLSISWDRHARAVPVVVALVKISMRLCFCFDNDGTQSRNPEPQLPSHPVKFPPLMAQPPQKLASTLEPLQDANINNPHAFDLYPDGSRGVNPYQQYQLTHPPQPQDVESQGSTLSAPAPGVPQKPNLWFLEHLKCYKES